MPETQSILVADEAWVIQELRRLKDNGFGTMVVKVHAGIAEGITVEQKLKRMSGVRVILKD